ncbi:MAG: VOC family protein [Vicinamibacterales bacterium]
MLPAAPATDARLLFQRLGEKWTIPLLRALYEHAHRYSAIKKRFPLTSKVLSRTLVALQKDQLVTRLESPVVRRSVTYELTPAGRRLVDLVLSFDTDFALQVETGHRVTPPATETSGTVLTSRRNQDVRPPLNPIDTELVFRFVTIATPEIAAFAAGFGTVLGLTAPRIGEIPITLPAGDDAMLRICTFRLQGFSVSFAQPLDARLPHAAFLASHGAGIHHLGFGTSARMDVVVPPLRAMGGTWTVGGPGATYAQLNFQAQLGAALGLSNGGGLVAPGEIDTAGMPAPGGAEFLSRHRVTNVGIVVGSIEETAGAFSNIFGLGVSPIRAVDLALPGVALVSHGAARIAYLRLNGVAIKLIEPLSDGPLAQVLQRHGNRAHHLGFDVGRAFSVVLARLEECGGRILLGRRDLGYALVDFSDAFGMVLELTGTAEHP